MIKGKQVYFVYLNKRLFTSEVFSIIIFSIIILHLEMGVGVKPDNEFFFKE